MLFSYNVNIIINPVNIWRGYMLEILNKLNHYSIEQPDMIALSFEEDVLTYQQLYTEIQQLKSVFMHLPKGSRVGLLSKSPLHNMLNYFAILEQGSIPCF